MDRWKRGRGGRAATLTQTAGLCRQSPETDRNRIESLPLFLSSFECGSELSALCTTGRSPVDTDLATRAEDALPPTAGVEFGISN